VSAISAQFCGTGMNFLDVNSKPKPDKLSLKVFIHSSFLRHFIDLCSHTSQDGRRVCSHQARGCCDLKSGAVFISIAIRSVRK
jgi:hypothetical protein